MRTTRNESPNNDREPGPGADVPGNAQTGLPRPKRSVIRQVAPGAALILAALLVAYAPAMKAGFIWDDDDHFVRDPLMESVAGLRAFWTTREAVYYPLTSTSWWFMRRLWGLNPFPYHLVNVLLHWANATLLWAALCRLKIRGGWLAGALFALHPVHVESVAWATELKNTQSGLFYLLAILAFMNWYAGFHSAETAPGPYRGNRRWYAASLGLFVLALLSKPSTVMLPVVLLLLLWWVDRRCTWRHIRLAMPFFVLSTVASLWTIWEQRYGSGAVGDAWSQSFLERTLISARIIGFYLGKLLWPHPLIFIYPRWEIRAFQPAAYLPLLALIVCGGALWWSRQGWARPFAFAFAYFVALLFPVLNFFDIYFTKYSYVGDHFQYLASIGPIALAAALVAAALERVGLQGQRGVYAAAGCVLVLFGALVWRQGHIYADQETLWRDTLAKNPDAAVAHLNLANLLVIGGELDQAVEHYNAILRIDPTDEEAYNNLGTVFDKQGKPEEAEHCFLAALRIQPDHSGARLNLVDLLIRQGRLEEAVARFSEIRRIHPNHVGHYERLRALLAEHTQAESKR